ncbi:peptidylprolyl isomerase [Candidatus Woesearchaeota archaeon]|nr:peptidylprolyl isomerase [Candidatus Woesearchaeota archaeon]
MDKKIAAKGSTVSIHYTGTFPDGMVFDSSEGRSPITFTIGEGTVIHGFESNVTGMAVGQEKEFDVSPEAGYGAKKQELIKEFPKEKFPDKDKLKVGQVIGFTSPEGTTYRAVVSSIGSSTVALDFNHLLAGKTLHFKIKLVDVRE